jgi:hypothetical protein
VLERPGRPALSGLPWVPLELAQVPLGLTHIRANL